MTSPLIITRDETLLDELLRLTAAAGVTPEVAPDPGAALRSWSAAPVVLVGVDVASELADLGPPRRVSVHFVGWGRVPDHVFKTAVGVGAENVAELPRSDAWLLELLADAGERAARDAVTVGVVGGSGGSGATTFACALALVGLARRTDLPDRCRSVAGRASTRCSGSTGSTGSVGTRCSRRPGDSARGRCTMRCPGSAGWAC